MSRRPEHLAPPEIVSESPGINLERVPPCCMCTNQPYIFSITTKTKPVNTQTSMKNQMRTIYLNINKIIYVPENC